jgi:hypothetical protein
MKLNEAANINIKFWRDVLKGTCKAKKILESLPQSIQELEAQSIACTYLCGNCYQISIWPVRIEDLALRFQWVHQTMLLFKNELNATWEEKPDVENKDSLGYTGKFKVGDAEFDIFIHECPPAPNCKIREFKSSREISSYEIECPEEVTA